MGSLEDYLEANERNTTALALEENEWNKTAAAERLKLSFQIISLSTEKYK